MTEVINNDDFKNVTNLNKKTKRKQKQKKLTLFSSNIVGKRIRNALSGTEYDERVGSVYEKLYWKVVTKDQERWGTDLNTGEPKLVASGYDTATYFYDSPEQYERIFNITISDDIKNEWYNKNGKVKIYDEKEDIF